MYCHAVTLGWMTQQKTLLILVPPPSHDCTCMSLLNPDLHALTVCLISQLSFTHTIASAIPQISVFFPFTHAAIYKPCIYPCISLSYICSSVLPFVYQPLSSQQCVVEKQIGCILSLSLCLSFFTPLSNKLNKELTEGHHLWLLCASIISLSANV